MTTTTNSNTIGVRLTTIASDMDTSSEAIRKVFTPFSPGEIKAGSRLVCRRTGIEAKVIGVRPVHGRNALHLHVAGQCGGTPFATDEAFLNRWFVVPDCVQLLEEGATTAIPSSLKTTFDALFDNQFGPPSLTAQVCARPVEVTALSLLGVQCGSKVEVLDGPHKGKVVSLHGVSQFLGTSEAPAAVVASLPSDGSLVSLSEGCRLRIVSQQEMRSFNPVAFAASEPRKATLVSSVAVKADDPIQCTFPASLGLNQQRIGLLDVDPDRCFRYFSARPGECVNSPSNATCLGMSFNDDETKVELWWNTGRHKGAGQFDGETTFHFTGETMKLPEIIGPIPASLYLPKPTKAKGKFAIPRLPQDESLYDESVPILDNGRNKVFADQKYMTKHFDLVPGQRCKYQAKTMSIVGIARDKSGDFELWFLLDGVTVCGTLSTGDEITLFEEIVELPPYNMETRIYCHQPLRKSLPLKLDSCYNFGKIADAFDCDERRCEAYFGILPGTRIDGQHTAIGIRTHPEDADQVVMVFHTDGDPTPSLFGSKGIAVNVDVDPANRIKLKLEKTRIIKYEKQKPALAYPLDPSFYYVTKGGDVRAFDIDAFRCEHYFGLKHGQRIDGNGTVIGMRLEPSSKLIEMWIHSDDADGAGVYKSGTTLTVSDQVVDVEESPYDPTTARQISVVPKEENPDDRIDPTTAIRFGLDPSQTVGMLVDSNPARCERYFSIRPGQRVTHSATCAGMAFEENGRVRLLFFVDGRCGAGQFGDQDNVTIESMDFRPIPTIIHAPSLFPIPSKGRTTVKVPDIPKLIKSGQCTFNKAYAFGGKPHMLDFNIPQHIVALKHGQRILCGSRAATVIGLCEQNGKAHLIVRIDGFKISGIADSIVTAFDEFVKVPTAENASMIVYHPKTFEPSKKIIHNTRYPFGKENVTWDYLDTDKGRVTAYFPEFPPGQRVEGEGTVVGIRKMDGGKVRLFCHMDGHLGAGSFSDGDPVLVETGLVVTVPIMDTAKLQRIAAREQASAAMQRTQREREVSYQVSDKDQSVAMPSEDILDVVPFTKETMSFPMLTPAHVAALRHVKANAQTAEASEQKQLVEKQLHGGGYADVEMTLFDMQHCLAYQVPIVSWFTPFKMIGGKPLIELMTEDFAMRSLHETLSGNGLQRIENRSEWERRLFGGAYDSAEAWERPKYGLFNLFNDPRGPRVKNDQYGDCFFVFTSDLRPFVTMTPFDSSGVTRVKCPVCTLDDGMTSTFAHFKSESEEIVTFADVATGQVPYAGSDASYYKELQIHHSVFFEQHVSHLVFDDSYLSRPADLHLLFNFCAKNGCGMLSISTMHKLAALRLLGTEELKNECIKLRIPLDTISLFVESSSGNATSVQSPTRTARSGRLQLQTRPTRVQYEPQAVAARAYFECLLNHLVREEMELIKGKINRSPHKAWKAPKKKEKEAERTPKKKSSSDDDGDDDDADKKKRELLKLLERLAAEAGK